MRTRVVGVFVLFLMLGLFAPMRGADDKDGDEKTVESLKKAGLNVGASSDGKRWIVLLADADLNDKGEIKSDRIDGLKKLKKELELAAFKCDLSNDGLAQIGGLSSVKVLVLSRTPKLTTLEPAAKIAGLKGLYLGEVPLDDKTLAPLAKCKALEGLTLRGVKMTDAGLAHVDELTGLKDLRVWNTDITSAAFERVKGLTNLEALEFVACPKVTGEGLENLKALTKLEKLALARTQTGDKGLENLKALKSLKVLNLIDTKVTDKGVDSLAALVGLEELNLQKTEVTEAGIGRLQKALPKAHVEH
jgi:internalin A